MADFKTLNRVLLLGRVTKDPDVKTVKDDTKLMARFNLATNELFRNPEKKKYEIRPEFHYIVAWGKRAEFMRDHVTKGRLLLIEGKLRSRYYDDEEGVKRRFVQVEAESIIDPLKKETKEEEEKRKGDPF